MISMDHALIGRPSFVFVSLTARDLLSPELNQFENGARFSMCLKLLLRMNSVSNHSGQTSLLLPLQQYFWKPALPLFSFGRMEFKPSTRLRSLKVFVWLSKRNKNFTLSSLDLILLSAKRTRYYCLILQRTSSLHRSSNPSHLKSLGRMACSSNLDDCYQQVLLMHFDSCPRARYPNRESHQNGLILTQAKLLHEHWILFLRLRLICEASSLSSCLAS